MRVKLRMIGAWGSFKAGEIVNPTGSLAKQLIEKKLAVPDRPSSQPEEKPSPAPAGAKKAK